MRKIKYNQVSEIKEVAELSNIQITPNTRIVIKLITTGKKFYLGISKLVKDPIRKREGIKNRIAIPLDAVPLLVKSCETAEHYIKTHEIEDE